MPVFKLQAEESGTRSGIRIGNIDYTSIAGIVFVQDDAAAFVITSPYFKPNPGRTAPDDSIHKLSDKGVDYEWGRVGDAFVGRFSSVHPARSSSRFARNGPASPARSPRRPRERRATPCCQTDRTPRGN